MGVYRQNVGVWSNKQKDYPKIISVFENLLFDFENFPVAKKLLTEHKNKYIKAMLYSKSFSEVIRNKNWKELSYVDRLKVLIKSL